jgi:prephenate dehydrogenase
VNRSVTLGLIGTGLIGASIGMRARELGWRALGCDTAAAQASAALARGAIDEIVTRDALLEQANTIVVATPPRAAIAELEALRGRSLRATLLIDVASVKAALCEAGRGVPNYVGTHPLAGSDRSGAAAARSTMFFDKPWIYVPPDDKPLEMRARDFIAAMGARAVPSEARVHDEVLGLTSHLPQLFATLFSKTARQQDVAELESFCGPVASELLRLGNSSAALWREIFAYNGTNVARYARDLAAKLTAAAQALVSEAEPEKHDADERGARRDK